MALFSAPGGFPSSRYAPAGKKWSDAPGESLRTPPVDTPKMYCAGVVSRKSSV